ncbi:3-keto-5-aminohexanoate cleavage protein [Cognatishimia sp. MH4019]|uniref:3-keto-5-aminohexanoate cleavage protein n=1 Tax=Cognatishimia sp. MH4019 TaxID=2854030 RepID=UPI001CD406D6|nr:3-keto-5-aminohexanoate cleavage protein [Cognatishimia sp. MH4019]
MPLPRIMVAPNGARLQKVDHPAIPLTDAEVITCAQACFKAGADAIHAHIRDADGQHLLDAARYRALVAALNKDVPGMAVQITTEAVGRYEPAHQVQVALEAGADMVSVSIRELCRADKAAVQAFLNDCADRKITLQFILYDAADCALLARTLPTETLNDPALQLLFVLGRYSQTPAQPEDLTPFLDWLSDEALSPDWAVCAFGPDEAKCLQHAARKGGKCRTGFENSLHLSNGSIAPDNAAKVTDLKALIG